MSNDPTDAPNDYEPDIARVAAQNDAFRAHECTGAPYSSGEVLRGRLVCTAAVAAMGQSFVVATCIAVAGQSSFSEEDDPDGYHDFGAVEVEGRRVWWKIDLFSDEELRWGAERLDDPSRTVRVLTILFPEDW